jgi:hypothetical protein
MYSINVPLCLITFLLLAPMASADEVPQLVQPDAAISFERQIRPILKTWCLDCHGGESVEGKLDLRPAPIPASGRRKRSGSCSRRYGRKSAGASRSLR